MRVCPIPSPRPGVSLIRRTTESLVKHTLVYNANGKERNEIEKKKRTRKVLSFVRNCQLICQLALRIIAARARSACVCACWRHRRVTAGLSSLDRNGGGDTSSQCKTRKYYARNKKTSVEKSRFHVRFSRWKKKIEEIIVEN